MAKQTVTAFFDDRENANNAVRLLRRYAIPDGDVTVSPEAAATGFAEEMPGHVKDFWAFLDNLFGATDDRHAYAEGVRRGHVMVTAHVDAAHVDDVVAILERHGSVDLTARESTWRDEGWTEGSAAAGDVAAPGVCSFETAQAAAGVLATPSARNSYRTSTVPANRGTVRVHPYIETPPPPQASRSEASADTPEGAVTEAAHAAEVAGFAPVAGRQRATGLEVVGSDGQHVGIIDRIDGTMIKLERQDPASGGPQHLLPIAWIRVIDGSVTLKLTAAEARSRWTTL